jgi:hypothetical protein
MMKKLLIASIIAGSLGTVALPSSAEVVVVRQAPPALRQERTPDPRHGYTWVAGHWEWKHNRHQWVRGAWLKDRRGYVYNQPTWAERDGRWEMSRGNWRRGDRDGDGVRNRDDSHPNNPNRN